MTLTRALSLIGRATLLALLLAGCGAENAALPDADAGRLTTTGDDEEEDAAPREVDAATTVVPADLPVATACTSNEECVSGHCADGVCCDGACDDACSSCALTGKIGTCAPVREAPDDTCDGDSICDAEGRCLPALGRACSTANSCASGNCVDGVCCASAGCGTCQSCAVPDSVGACAPVAKLEEDPDTCTGDRACNGLGGCQLRNGAACGDDSACLSRACADGVCCDQACAGTCYACNQLGREGTCAPLNSGEDKVAASICELPKLCSLRGTSPVCKLPDDAPCTTSDDCLGGSCLTTYPDADGDGYGDPQASVRRCEGAPKPGHLFRAGDCCDLDRLSSPAATIARTFRNLCGSYDWNCNGVEEPQSGGAVK
jgi:hypothetical protein